MTNMGRLLGLLFLILSVVLLVDFGYSGRTHVHEGVHSAQDEHNKQNEMDGGKAQGERIPLGLDQAALRNHQAIMRDHLEAVHEIVAALARKNFEEAQLITESRLGFAKHREAMQRQRPETFPPAYHDLARKHHQAAESLAAAMASRDLDRILPQLEKTLNACVMCHKTYTY